MAVADSYADNGAEDYYDGNEDEDYCEDLDLKGEIKQYEDGKKYVKLYNVVDGRMYDFYETYVKGDVETVTVAGRNTVIRTSEGILVYTDGREYLVTKGYAVKALKSFDYVVKDEVKGNKTTIWFANAKAEVKVYTVEQSADRGELITVD